MIIFNDMLHALFSLFLGEEEIKQAAPVFASLSLL